MRSYYGEAERFWRALLDDPAQAERKKTVVDVGANVGFYSLWPAADGHRREAVATSCAINETHVDFDAILLSSIRDVSNRVRLSCRVYAFEPHCVMARALRVSAVRISTSPSL